MLSQSNEDESEQNIDKWESGHQHFTNRVLNEMLGWEVMGGFIALMAKHRRFHFLHSIIFKLANALSRHTILSG